MAQANLFSPQTQWGSSLQNLVSALYDPTASTQRAAREAKAERDRADAALKRAQIADYQAKRDAEAAKRTEEATMISDLVSNFMGGAPQGGAVMDYRAAGGRQLPSVSGRPDVDDGGVPQAMDPMPRPEGYTPQREMDLNRILTSVTGARHLGDKSFSSAMKGGGEIQEQGARGAIMGDGSDPMKTAQAFFATSGKAPFDDDQGRVLNLVSGALNEQGPQAVANVAKTGSETRENDAQARRYGRDDQPLVQVMTPTGPVWQPRGRAVGKPAVLAGAQKVADAMFEPTKPNVTAGQKDLNNIAQTRSVINRFMEAANADERNFGVSGFIRETAQDAMQQGKALGLTVGSMADQFVADINTVGHEVGVENFDKNLPLLDLYANVLAFQMAQTLAPGDRVTDQDYKRFRAMIGDSGMLGNQRAVKERVAGILAMVDDKERTIRSFLSGGRNAPAGATPPAAVPDAPRVIQYDAQGNRLN